MRGHAAEVQSCEWNHINKRMILSASMDKSIKLWDAENMAADGALNTFLHEQTAY
jgi:WD40 repeat protein